jgi:hypothetical protein
MRHYLGENDAKMSAMATHRPLGRRPGHPVGLDLLLGLPLLKKRLGNRVFTALGHLYSCVLKTKKTQKKHQKFKKSSKNQKKRKKKKQQLQNKKKKKSANWLKKRGKKDNSGEKNGPK